MKLNKRQVGVVQDAVNDIFYRLKSRLLGRYFGDLSLHFEVTRPNPMDSLESVYRYTTASLYGAGAPTDENHVKMLVNIAGNYIEAQRLRTMNAAIHEMAAAPDKQAAAEAFEKIL